LKTPIALISLIDKDRQWFKSHHGIDAQETPRELAFCAHAILGNEVLLVPNATKDPRFLGNPLVTGAPDIRFYAGAPLTTPDGDNIGTLCVIDQQIRNDFGAYEIGVLSDLAAMVIDELEFHVAVQKEKIANHAKSSFLANMSHEIRTPMNGVLGVAGLLMDTKLDNKQKELVNIIRKSGDALLEIVNDILDVSKIEAGELKLEQVNFSLRESVNDIYGLLNIKAIEQKVELLTEIDKNVPDYYIGDVGRVRQIILNLLSNSIKFTNGGYVKLKIKHKDKNKEGAQLLFEIEDNGIGIPEDKLDYIFNKFTQAEESTTRKFGGTGLGLAICKNLTHMMNGSIGVRSTLGKGSTFYFDITLPYGYSVEKKVVNKISSRLMFPNLRVLVVDDMKLNMMLVVRILEKHGCIADTASNGQESVDAVKKRNYDIIFMDCHMPLMDGYEATREIRKYEQSNGKKHTPIVAITADAMNGNEERCLKAGMDKYLNKPVKETDIENMLKNWFEGCQRIEKAILVAEDDIVSQMILSTLLIKNNYIVDISSDGMDALKNITSKKYDLIFMDYGLPKLSGPEVSEKTRNINNENKDTPIIAFTGHILGADEIKQHGMNGYLMKPIEEQKLTEILEQWLGNKHQIKEPL
jgi:signal transduction histidine kinase/CheY-like chemotaxis protein